METQQTTLVKKSNNPFKFLTAYQEAESDQFFGRNKESKDLIDAFRKSSFVVLYGPSGSGKSSLINCGLLKKLKIKEDKVFKIRRSDKGLIESITQELTTKLGKNWGLTVKDLIVSLTQKRLELAHIRQDIKQLNKKIIGLEAQFQKREITVADLKKQSTTLLALRKVKEDLISKNKKTEKSKKEQFIKLFQQFRYSFNATPYLIFDQFEEIFTSGSKTEEEEFNTFLNLVFTNNLSVKILLSLRQEYFSKLKKFEQYIPHVLYRQCLVDNPDRSTIFKILKHSFKRFNINQKYDKSNLPTSELPIEEAEKEERINQLINKLEGNEKGGNEFHLPFMQIYLYKLWELDYAKSLKKNPAIAFEEFPHLEFEVSEIDEFGDIQNILNQYIIETNHQLLANPEISFNEFTRSQNVVIRFLRHFKHDDNTKKRISTNKIEGGNKKDSYYITDEKTRKGIKESIWREVNDDLYNSKIDFIIHYLIQARLLTFNDGFTELSHDFIARIINTFPIERNLEEIYKDSFNYSFEIFKKNGAHERDFLTENDLARFNSKKLLDFIIGDVDDVQKEQKRIYWEKSKAAVQFKKNAALREKEKQLAEKDALVNERDKQIAEKEKLLIANTDLLAERDQQIVEKEKLLSDKLNLLEERSTQIKKLESQNYTIRILASLAIVALCITGYFFYDSNKSKNKATENEVKAENEKKKSTAQGSIYAETGEAYSKLRNDRTEAFKKVDQSQNSWIKYIIAFFKLEKNKPEQPLIIGDFKNDLYINLHNYPFYAQQIALSKKDKSPIIYTKYLSYQSNSDSVAIFFLTADNKLFQSNTNYKIGVEKPIHYEEVAENVTAFEPYWEKDNQLAVLLVSEDQIFRKRSNQATLDTLKDLRGMVTIENAKFLAKYKNRFVANYLNNIIEFTINEEGLSNMKIILNNKREIESFQQLGNDDYLVVFQNDRYFIRSEGGGIKRLEKRLQHKHEDGIASMDRIKVDGNYQWLLGSYDRTASIWAKGKEQKRLVGHGDKILKTSFLDRENGNFVMTSSADGTIKIWNLMAYDKGETKIKKASQITKLKFKDSLLYTGFKFKLKKEIDAPEGYMISICESLNDSCITKYEQDKRDRENRGNITSFGFGQNGLIVSSYFSELISSTNGSENVRLRDSEKGLGTINNIEVQGEKLVAATKKGLFYFPDYSRNYLSPPHYYKPLDTLKGQNLNSVHFHPNKPLILVTAENSNIYIWNIEDKSIQILSNHLDKVKDAEFSKDGNWIISGSWDNTAILWQWENDEYVKHKSFLAHTNDIEDVEFFGNDLFLTASSDHTVRIFKRENKTKPFKPIPSLIRHDHKITAATFSADGQYIYSGDDNGVIKKWAFREFEDDIKERLGINQ